MMLYEAAMYSVRMREVKGIMEFKRKVREEGLLVVKCSGKTLGLADEIAALKRCGAVRNLVLVHGGGVQITSAMKALGMEVRFHDGYRVTDEAAMEVVEREIVKINAGVSESLRCAGVGVASFIYGVFYGRSKGTEVMRYGGITHTDYSGIAEAVLGGEAAVVAPIGRDWAGGKLNLNADDAAVAAAIATKAKIMVLTTDVDGIMARGELIAKISAGTLARYISDGTVNGGMVAKSRACIQAAEHGIPAKIIKGEDGRLARALGGDFLGTLVEPHFCDTH